MRRSSSVSARARKPKTKNRRYSTLVLGPLPENAAARQNLQTDRRSRAPPGWTRSDRATQHQLAPLAGVSGGVAGLGRSCRRSHLAPPPPLQSRSEAEDQQCIGDQRTDTCSLSGKRSARDVRGAHFAANARESQRTSVFQPRESRLGLRPRPCRHSASGNISSDRCAAGFPASGLRPNETYRQRIGYRFGVAAEI